MQSSNRAASESAEKEFKSTTFEIKPGTEWDRVSKLCDFNPKVRISKLKKPSKVTHLLVNQDWTDFMLDVPLCGPVTSAQFPSGRQKSTQNLIQPNPFHEQRGHPKMSQYWIKVLSSEVLRVGGSYVKERPGLTKI